MNTDQILEKIKDLFEESISDFAYEEDFIHEEIPFKQVEQVGGEDQGSTWYSIKYFPKQDIYIKVSGYYSSYNGTDFEDGWGEEVKPVEKTVTFYE
jgi:hypothetical protein